MPPCLRPRPHPTSPTQFSWHSLTNGGSGRRGRKKGKQNKNKPSGKYTKGRARVNVENLNGGGTGLNGSLPPGSPVPDTGTDGTETMPTMIAEEHLPPVTTRTTSQGAESDISSFLPFGVEASLLDDADFSLIMSIIESDGFSSLLDPLTSSLGEPSVQDARRVLDQPEKNREINVAQVPTIVSCLADDDLECTIVSRGTPDSVSSSSSGDDVAPMEDQESVAPPTQQNDFVSLANELEVLGTTMLVKEPPADFAWRQENGLFPYDDTDWSDLFPMKFFSPFPTRDLLALNEAGRLELLLMESEPLKPPA